MPLLSLHTHVVVLSSPLFSCAVGVVPYPGSAVFHLQRTLVLLLLKKRSCFESTYCTNTGETTKYDRSFQGVCIVKCLE